MKRDLSGSTARRLSIGLAASALVASAALASTPAQATSRPVGSAASAATVHCTKPTSHPTKWREASDVERVSGRVKAEVDAVVAAAARTSAQRSAQADSSPSPQRTTAARRVVVPVYIHLIHGRHKGEHRIGRYAGRRMFRILKAGYAGAQDRTMTDTGVRFTLRRITVSRNDRWFHARPYSRADRQMKSRLHRGGARVLNIYVNRPKAGGQLLLGFSTFPWQRAAHPRLDSVTVSDVSLPYGPARGYNLGDTVIHETGHWLGLLHTFEGGCTAPGDGVADTPPEATASYYCDETSNTCHEDAVPDPSDPLKTIDPTDPVHNFMDYSYDACMYQFTPGQTARINAAFMHFRYGR